VLFQRITVRPREPRDQSLQDFVLLDRERVKVRLLDLAEHAGLHQSSELGEGYQLLAAAEPAVVAASNVAETTTEAYVIPSTVSPALGFAIPSNSHLVDCLLAFANPCAVKVGVEVKVGVMIVVQLPVPTSAVQPPLPVALHLQAPIILAEPCKSHSRVAHLQHRPHIGGMQRHCTSASESITFDVCCRRGAAGPTVASIAAAVASTAAAATCRSLSALQPP